MILRLWDTAAKPQLIHELALETKQVPPALLVDEQGRHWVRHGDSLTMRIVWDYRLERPFAVIIPAPKAAPVSIPAPR